MNKPQKIVWKVFVPAQSIVDAEFGYIPNHYSRDMVVTAKFTPKRRKKTKKDLLK